MKLREALSVVASVAEGNDFSEPFIVGGVPRDKLLGILHRVEDIDITTGSEDVVQLGFVVQERLAGMGSRYMRFPDGHAQVNVGDLKLDFSSHWIDPHAETALKEMGIGEPTPMQLETFSRDFTCNCLLLNLDLASLKDPTGRGLPDIEDRYLRTPLSVDITLTDDPRRIARAIYLAAKLDFWVDDEIIRWSRENIGLVAGVAPGYTKLMLNRAVKNNPEKARELVRDLGLEEHVPVVQEIRGLRG
jgi:tRNA nucleotidyltransferase/poly(A) polymerase